MWVSKIIDLIFYNPEFIISYHIFSDVIPSKKAKVISRGNCYIKLRQLIQNDMRYNIILILRGFYMVRVFGQYINDGLVSLCYLFMNYYHWANSYVISCWEEKYFPKSNTKNARTTNCMWYDFFTYIWFSWIWLTTFKTLH